jgi:CRP/FNR family cyclic AMP-dependent transcriptional regulator
MPIPGHQAYGGGSAFDSETRREAQKFSEYQSSCRALPFWGRQTPFSSKKSRLSGFFPPSKTHWRGCECNHLFTSAKSFPASQVAKTFRDEQYRPSLVIVRVLKLKVPGHPMAKQRLSFDPKTFLSTVGAGRTMAFFRKGQAIYGQGDATDTLFVIQKGKVKLSVKSQSGKEATLDILGDGDFVGKDSIAGQPSRTASASAMTDCSLLRIEKRAMMLALRRQVKLANMLWAYVLARNIRYQQDLVDQRCNLSEKRLARLLVLLAHFDGHGVPHTLIPKISHKTLAEMVGTTRSRVCFFMKRFKDSGFIYYNQKSKLTRVHRTLLAFCTR